MVIVVALTIGFLAGIAVTLMYTKKYKNSGSTHVTSIPKPNIDGKE